MLDIIHYGSLAMEGEWATAQPDSEEARRPRKSKRDRMRNSGGHGLRKVEGRMLSMAKSHRPLRKNDAGRISRCRKLLLGFVDVHSILQRHWWHNRLRLARGFDMAEVDIIWLWINFSHCAPVDPGHDRVAYRREEKGRGANNELVVLLAVVTFIGRRGGGGGEGAWKVSSDRGNKICPLKRNPEGAKDRAVRAGRVSSLT